MHIRLASEEDLAAVVAFYHVVSDAMTGTPYDCCWRRDGHPTSEFIAELVRGQGMLIAIEGNAIVGAVGIDHDLGHNYGPLLWLFDVPETEVAVIHLLASSPSRRGAGISRTLLRESLNLARARGMRTARLDVTVNNAPAMALYRSEGFVTVGGGYQDIGPDDHSPVWLDVMELPLVASQLNDEDREQYMRIIDRELVRSGIHLPTSQQVAAALAAMALVSPAALGGIPVLPVTLDEQRRRQQEQILAESDSSVGVHQSVQEAATALTLSQRRLASVTREVEGTHAHDVTEADVVHAAQRVLSGEATPHQSSAFRAALGRVAIDTADLYILLSDEVDDEDYYEDPFNPDPEEDLEAWLAEFE